MSASSAFWSRRRLLAAGAMLPLAAPALAEHCAVTASQVRGPFYPPDWKAEHEFDLTQLEGHAQQAAGERIVVSGQVLDGHCQPLEGALVELWQANAAGRYAHPADRNPAPLDPHFQGAGQVVTDADGRYRFVTIKPGAYALEYLDGRPSDAGFRPCHLHLRVVKRGHAELTTQMYFAGDPHQDSDPVLQRLPPAQRAALIISPEPGAEYRFDLHLQAA